MSDSIILMTDSYKLTHWKQYPDDTEAVYSYFESRKGAQFPFTVFFGLQYILDHIEGVQVSYDSIKYAEEIIDVHMGPGHFNRAGWEHILTEHGGRLPIRIKAVPEGSIIPTGNVLMTVENTDPECYWLTNYVETILTHVWYGSTVATLSKWVKNQYETYLGATGDTSGIDFMLHDFGFRGASSLETAGIGGAAHLVNFKGTDTLAALEVAIDYYDADPSSLAFSVPATEHSIMTSLGRYGEYDILDNLLDTYPTGILSVVSDSYNIYKFTEAVIKRKDKIMARDGAFVLRPDSITHDHPSAPELMSWITRSLWDAFGGHENSKGYKVLDDHIRVIWGDGIDHNGIVSVLRQLKEEGFASENFVFGMGGGLLQKVNRDTQRFAFKSSAQKRSGVWYDVSKEPLDASKASKRGRLKLVRENGYKTINEAEFGYDDEVNLLVPVFEDGEILKRYSFDEVRANAEG